MFSSRKFFAYKNTISNNYNVKLILLIEHVRNTNTDLSETVFILNVVISFIISRLKINYYFYF